MASIPTIQSATGIQPRSIISSLNTLVDRQLITRIPQSGNQPNQYDIPALHQELIEPPTNDTLPKSAATPPAATIATGATMALAVTKSSQATTHPLIPPQATIPECVAACYRPISAQELSQINQVYPNEVDLRKNLEWIKSEGGVENEMPLSFFFSVLLGANLILQARSK